MSENKIKCPNCGTQIDIDEVLFHQAEEKLNDKQKIANLEILKKEEAIKQREVDFEEKRIKANEEYNIRRENDRQKIAKEESEKAQKDSQLQLSNLLQQIEKLTHQKQEAEKKELQALNREKEIKEREENLQLIIAREVSEKTKEDSERIEIKFRKQFADESELKLKQKDEQLEQIKKQLEDANKKANQGSTQIQGEALEHLVEEYLKEKFKFDDILEVVKGMRGADCMQIINTPQKQNCGKIIYECKNAKAFSGDWIEKLKNDKRTSKSDIAVLITTIYPKDIERMEFKDGVWICSLEEFKGLSIALRESLIQVSNVFSQQQNKGDKVTMLYDYLSGNEFRNHIEAIVESFSEMKIDLEKEKKYFQKIWKEREIQIDKVVNNTIQLYGSIKGIGGKEIMTIQQLELPE